MEGIQMKYFENLICPYTKQRLIHDRENLITKDGRIYPIVENIPCFISKEEIEMWNGYHKVVYSDEPNPAHPYYTKFTEGWKNMLDLGCGDGTMSAGSAYKVKHIYCVDPSLRALKILQKRNIQNMYPIVAVGEHLPFEDDFFDGVINIFVIEHLIDPLPMLAEIHRVLKPDGELVIGTDTKWFYRYTRFVFEWKEKGWDIKKWKPDDPTHVNLMVPEKLRRCLKKTKFEIIHEDISYFRFSRFTKVRWILQWLPKRIWDSFLSSSFRLICKPVK